ncbi:uncharacterized protein LOC123399493 [Hordeum vulgare subsp. vulgare]|uniref:uncharacterized protein LOC123399493 n=1 Tax=Hordeum vulgare subsp. vulgare TaxID=112509 RepID=UPI001D1A3BBB|nr:uncharacterized protein LOC123399493 [Hordeum vulgare subsp. vulgare]
MVRRRPPAGKEPDGQRREGTCRSHPIFLPSDLQQFLPQLVLCSSPSSSQPDPPRRPHLRRAAAAPPPPSPTRRADPIFVELQQPLLLLKKWTPLISRKQVQPLLEVDKLCGPTP